MQQETKWAVIYARSAAPQEKGSSFPTDAQIQACIQYASEHGYQLVQGQVYAEIGSGLTVNREKLLAVLTAAQNGIFDHLLVYDFARLARNPVVLVNLLKQFEETGVTIECVTEPFHADVVRMLAALHQEVSRLEHENRAARSRAGRSRKQSQNPQVSVQ
jgi:DNA invertase Pin-like site-specific DNA recombinase